MKQINIDIDRLIDAALDSMSAEKEYRSSSAKYYRTHHHGLHLDRVETAEERNIEYYYHTSNAERDALRTVFEVLSMDAEQRNRLYTAARAARKYYILTHYERCLTSDLLDRLAAYIMG